MFQSVTLDALVAASASLFAGFLMTRKIHRTVAFGAAAFFGMLALTHSWLIALGIAVLAGYAIYFHENVPPLSPERIIQRPALRLSLSGGNIFTPNQRPDLTGIALDVSIWNVGSPSAAIEWGLQVRAGDDGERLASIAYIIPERLTLSGEHNAEIFGVNSLVEKTRTAAIGIVPIHGLLLFYLPVAKNRIKHPAARLEVWVVDIHGARSSVAQEMGPWLLTRRS